ncbi:DNA primase [Streptomyces cavernae]|uniref:DNA primase n=1 Tax=Streptomyces cavernae TaxID=2259034 RepID=UPI000FEB948D|nr:DNA primase [Streptomyces cavernae]
MNRVGLGLAVGAGYVLGRTKKMKMAVALGTLAAGKRMQLSPRAVAELVNRQLKDNPQLKEVSDELRADLRGVGKAASGALVERQMSGLADRLHGRTAQVRDKISGVAPDVPGLGGQDDESEESEESEGKDTSAPRDEREEEPAEQDEDEPGARGTEPARTATAPAKKAAKKAPARKKAAPAQKTAPAKKAAKKTAAKKTAAKGTTRRASEGRRR